jgi:cytochrome P450
MIKFDDAAIHARLVTIRGALWALSKTGDPGARLMSLRPAEDPHPVYAQVRSQGKLVHSRLGIRLTASYSLCQEVLRDPRFGVAPISALTRIDLDRRAGAGDRCIQPVDDSFLTINPPEHDRLRKLVSPSFTPRALRQRAAMIEQVVGEILDEMSERPSFDAISDFAVRVALNTITTLLGIREIDQERFVWWGVTLARTLNGVRTMAEVREVRTVLVELEDFFAELIAYRSREPGEDLVSELVRCEADGRPLDRKDLFATAELLFVAGFETMVNLVGNAVLILLADQEARAGLLARPETAEDVVEEVLRIDSPVQYVARVTREPLTVGEQPLPGRSTVVLLLGAANRDPTVFAEPDRFDPRRPNNRDHLAFSAGIHYCLGAGLARLQAAVLLRELFQRFPGLVQAGPVQRRPSRNIRGVISLPVRSGAPSHSGSRR